MWGRVDKKRTGTLSCVESQEVLYLQSNFKTVMKKLLTTYLYASVVITTTAVGSCFVWYKQEYDLAYKLDKVGQVERAEIHRTNSLWLGLWGGVYGMIGVAAASALLKDNKNSK